MANYKDIKGFTVQSLSLDPAASALSGGTWSSGGDINERRYSMSGGGTVSAAWIASGYSPTLPGVSPKHEQYDGSTWTELADLDNGRNGAGGAGTTTAALVMGGYLDPGFSNVTESWNGSSWTELNTLNTSRYGAGSFGLHPAALFVGGNGPPSHAATALVEQWNGSTWSEVAEISTASGSLLSTGTGTTTAGIIVGGTITEQWNGTGWTEVADLNDTRTSGNNSGTSTSCIYAGGPGTPRSAKVEAFDGTSWTTAPSLSTGRTNAGTGHTSSSVAATFVAGGSISGSPDATTATEEWAEAPAATPNIIEGQVYYNSTSTNAFKVSQYDYPGGTFAAGGSMNQKRYGINGCGNQTAALVAGGDTYNDSPRATADSETYDGTSWTEGSDLNEGTQGSRQAGTTTASVLVYANTPFGTELYNGASWSDNPSTLNTGRNSGAMGGIQTAALFCGGSPPATNIVEEFNGSSWSEKGDLNTARGQASAVGTTTAMLVTGGDVPPYSALTETYDGTSWTETGDLPIAKSEMGIIGSTGSAMVCMGSVSPPGGPSGIVTGAPSQSLWNGSTWTAGSGYPIQVRGGGGCGPAATGVFMGGIGTPNDSVTTTNEWTASLTNKTITVS